MNENSYDIIIIGAGPGGLTAAIYAARDGHKTLILEKGICGGLVNMAHLIENYPGFPDGIRGSELMELFSKQAERFGAENYRFEEVKEVKPTGDGKITVRTDKDEYTASAVIIASGSVPKKLGIPGEEELVGKGVSYCAVCDGAFFEGLDVAVIGCGNSGLQEGEALLDIAKSVTFVEFLPYIHGEKILQERIGKSDKAKFFINHELVSIDGEGQVESITIKDRAGGEEKKIEVGGVFMYVGFKPNTAFLNGLVELDEKGYIITDDAMATSVRGIFAVGDVRSKAIRQITLACADATTAAINAAKYIKLLKS